MRNIGIKSEKGPIDELRTGISGKIFRLMLRNITELIKYTRSVSLEERKKRYT